MKLEFHYFYMLYLPKIERGASNMKKRLKTIISICLIFSSIITLASCNKDTTYKNVSKNHYVFYDINYEYFPEVEKGEQAKYEKFKESYTHLSINDSIYFTDNYMHYNQNETLNILEYEQQKNTITIKDDISEIKAFLDIDFRGPITYYCFITNQIKVNKDYINIKFDCSHSKVKSLIKTYKNI